jgi:hypothetical protein
MAYLIWSKEELSTMVFDALDQMFSRVCLIKCSFLSAFDMEFRGHAHDHSLSSMMMMAQEWLMVC